MKITKDLLKKIISEELQKMTINEGTVNVELDNKVYTVEYDPEDGQALSVNNIYFRELEKKYPRLLAKIDDALPAAIEKQREAFAERRREAAAEERAALNLYDS